MNGLPYYKAYPRDFIEGTIGMPGEIKCAYRLVLDLIYMQGGKLPDDARYVAGLLGYSVRKWNQIRSALIDAGKIAASDGCLTNYRAIIELESLAKLSEKQAENARGSRNISDLEKPRQSHTEPEPEVSEESPSSLRSEGARSDPDPWDSAPGCQTQSPGANPQPSVIDPVPVPDPRPDPAQIPIESAEDEFWHLAAKAEIQGMFRKSLAGKLLGLSDDVDDALDALKRCMGARKPSDYIGKTIKNLKEYRALQSADLPRPPDIPNWVWEATRRGEYVEHVEPNRWRYYGELRDDAGEWTGW